MAKQILVRCKGCTGTCSVLPISSEQYRTIVFNSKCGIDPEQVKLASQVLDLQTFTVFCERQQEIVLVGSVK